MASEITEKLMTLRDTVGKVSDAFRVIAREYPSKENWDTVKGLEGAVYDLDRAWGAQYYQDMGRGDV